MSEANWYFQRRICFLVELSFNNSMWEAFSFIFLFNCVSDIEYSVPVYEEKLFLACIPGVLKFWVEESYIFLSGQKGWKVEGFPQYLGKAGRKEIMWDVVDGRWGVNLGRNTSSESGREWFQTYHFGQSLIKLAYWFDCFCHCQYHLWGVGGDVMAL